MYEKICDTLIKIFWDWYNTLILAISDDHTDAFLTKKNNNLRILCFGYKNVHCTRRILSTCDSSGLFSFSKENISPNRANNR